MQILPGDYLNPHLELLDPVINSSFELPRFGARDRAFRQDKEAMCGELQDSAAALLPSGDAAKRPSLFVLWALFSEELNPIHLRTRMKHRPDLSYASLEVGQHNMDLDTTDPGRLQY
jgi:hypothetical protein